MKLEDLFKRMLVVLMRIKPKVLNEEEKEKARQKMMEENRKQDRDLFTCEKELIEGLKIEEVPLSSCGAWMVKKEGNQNDKVVYYIHGGGFVNSCTKSRMSFVSYLARVFHYNVFSIDYRLSPEVMYPCALEDCLEGYKKLLESYDSGNIVFIGESAGGNLVLTLAMKVRDIGLPLPAAIYSNSPVTQMVEYTESYRKYSLKRDFIVTEGILENMAGIYFEKGQEKDPYISPLYGDCRGLPPVTLTASNHECLLDDAKMMFEKLKEAGNEAVLKTYDDLCHAFIISPQMKEVVKNAYPDLEAFLNQYLSEREV